ncbi:hypothetical protein O3Q51_05325 [Cryomorphaceae bacterium 1068]|nr:hypothetical protein [Cryomorphaceae bacterium 1068]
MAYLKTVALFLFFFGSLFAKAEYNGYHIEFDLTLSSGETVHGYQYLTGYISTSDDMSLEEYIEGRKDLLLNNHFQDGLGDYAFFQNRIKYEWGGTPGNRHFIFTLIDKQSIDTAAVRSIAVSEIIPYSYITGVVSTHQMADTVWMKADHLEYRTFGGYLCSYQLFFHEWNTDLEKAIADAETQLKKVEDEIAQLEEDLKYVDGTEYHEIEAQIEELTESLDQIASDALVPFFDYKVVIIGECTC